MEEMTTPTVLIADDDEDILNLVRFRLEHEGLRVVTARDGREALELVRTEQPDLCVLDVVMPKLGGIELAQQLRGEARTAGIRIILLTSLGDGVEIADGDDPGADDYVKKPFNAQDLGQRVRAQLAR
jgi:two-component system alkaline phosphatase synthesis response regulator PhoP